MTLAVAVGIWKPSLPGAGLCGSCGLRLLGPVAAAPVVQVYPSLTGLSFVAGTQHTHTWPCGGIWCPVPALPIRNATATCVRQLTATGQGL